MKTIELEKLVGLHVLSGVETGYVKEKEQYGEGYENCNYISFILDGKTYTAIEDPDDGYRSCMRYLKIGGRVKNRFSDTQVLCSYDIPYGYDNNNLLQFLSAQTGKLILAVGTADVDDYYPYFVAEFKPENLPVNAGR